MREFTRPIFTQLPLRYGGLDIVEDSNGKLWLLEINGKPAYNYLVKDNGEDILIELYRDILSRIV